MKIKRISPEKVRWLLYFDALFVMAFSIWWGYTSKVSVAPLIGLFAGHGLLDLSARASGEKYLDDGLAFTFWAVLIIIAVTTALASLGILEDGLGLLSR